MNDVFGGILVAFLVAVIAAVCAVASVNEAVWRFSVLAVLVGIAFLLDVSRKK